jgi:hypothetical protein
MPPASQLQLEETTRSNLKIPRRNLASYLSNLGLKHFLLAISEGSDHWAIIDDHRAISTSWPRLPATARWERPASCQPPLWHVQRESARAAGGAPAGGRSLMALSSLEARAAQRHAAATATPATRQRSGSSGDVCCRMRVARAPPKSAQPPWGELSTTARPRWHVSGRAHLGSSLSWTSGPFGLGAARPPGSRGSLSQDPLYFKSDAGQMPRV